MACCTEFTRWRMQKPSRNDKMLLWMGTSPDSHCELTAGRISSRLKFLFVIEHAKSYVKCLEALVQTFAIGPLRQTTGMVIVMAPHQPPMLPFHNGSYYCKPDFRVRSTDIVPLHVIQRAVHLHPQTTQPDSTWWYLRNTIVLNAFNFFDI